MLKLSDFFAPLGIENISILLAFIACCEVIGFSLAKVFIKKIPDFLRGAIWLLGLGLTVFLYFLSHFFIPFAFPAVVICIGILLIPSIRIYLKEKGWRSLASCFKGVSFPILLLLPAIPLIFIKSSLPPYVWDEMAYHYISPYALYYQRVWTFGSGFMENLPRLLETAFIAVFSLTKTYAVARLLHFSIFVTALLTVYKFIKDNLGKLPATLFFILVAYHGETFLIRSTFGYVDVAAASFATLGIICLVSFLFKNNFEILSLSAAFWGMAVGTKYFSLTPFLVFLLICSVLIFRRKLLGKKYLKMYILAALLFFIMGGYWYLKNFIHTGNPIYPIFTSLFGCRFPDCPTISVSDWTMPFSLDNARQILDRIFASDKLLKILFSLSLPLSFFHPEKKVRKIFYLLVSVVLSEFFIIRLISGYDSRYFYHWQFLSIFLIVLPTTGLTKEIKSIKKFLPW